MKKILYSLLILLLIIGCKTNKKVVEVLDSEISEEQEIIIIHEPTPVEEYEIIEESSEYIIYEETSLVGVSNKMEIESEPEQNIVYEDSSYGDINYVMKDTMVVNKSSIVNMTISESVDRETIIKNIDSFTNENTHTSIIRISPIMRAKLIDPNGENFRIIPITPEEQIVENDQITKWEWDVTPLKEGNNKLKLTVDIIYEENSKNVEVYEDFIYVYSDKTWWDDFVDFISSNWEWFLSTLIIPLFIWVYNKRKEKN